jgi:hypothetical protein
VKLLYDYGFRDQLAVGKTPAWDAAGDLLAWQATDWLGHRGR